MMPLMLAGSGNTIASNKDVFRPLVLVRRGPKVLDCYSSLDNHILSRDHRLNVI